MENKSILPKEPSTEGYEIELFMTEYFANSIFYQIFSFNSLSIILEDDDLYVVRMKTWVISDLVGKDLTKFGFKDN